MKTLIQRFTRLIPALLRHSAGLACVALVVLPAHSATETYVIERSETKEIGSISLSYGETQLLGFDSKQHLRLKVVAPHAWQYLGQWHILPGTLTHYSDSDLAIAEQSSLQCDFPYDLGTTYLSDVDFQMLEAYFKQVKTCAIQVEFNAAEKRIESIAQLCSPRKGHREPTNVYKFSLLSATTCPDVPKHPPIKFVANTQPVATNDPNDLEAKLNFHIQSATCTYPINNNCLQVEMRDSKGNTYVAWATDRNRVDGWVYRIQSYPKGSLDSDWIGIRKEEFGNFVKLTQRQCELTLTADSNTRVVEQVTYRNCQAP